MAKNSPEQDEILAATRAAQERGEDPLGDDEPIVQDTIEARAARAKASLDRANGVDPEEDPDTDPALNDLPAAEKAAAQAAKEGKPAAEAAEEVAPEADDDEVDDSPTPYRGKALSEIQTERAALRAEKSAEFKRFSSGEIDDEAYTAKEAEIQDKIDTLNRAQAKAEARQEDMHDYQMRVVGSIMTKAADEGIDYKTDVRAQKQYDSILTSLLQDPEERRPFKALAKDAHAAVLAMRGIAKAKGAADPAADEGEPKPAAKTGKPPARVSPPGPTTLRNVPAAAANETGKGGTVEMMRGLKGQAYEAAFAKLSAKQKAELLDE